MPGTLYLCGAGNPEGVRLALAVNAASRRFDHIVLLDDNPATRGARKLGVPVEGPIASLAQADPLTDGAVNLVARTTAGRRAVRERIVATGIPLVPLVSPDVDTDGVQLADDVIVYRHATLGPETILDAGAVVFMGAVVGHGSTVGPGSVVAANAVLNARVELGEGVYIGSTATLIPELHVGDWATVGAGSLVLQDVPAGASVLGVPAEVVYCREDAAQGHGAPASLVIGEADTRPARSVAQLQTVIAEAWQSILGHASGMEQSFFDAGGTSLCAMRVRERLLEREQIRLATTDIYRFPTVRSLAEHLARGEDGLAASAMGRAAARLAARRAR